MSTKDKGISNDRCWKPHLQGNIFRSWAKLVGNACRFLKAGCKLNLTANALSSLPYVRETSGAMKDAGCAQRTGSNGNRLAQEMFPVTGAPLPGRLRCGKWAARLLSDSTAQPTPEDHRSEGTNRLITFVGVRSTRKVASIPHYLSILPLLTYLQIRHIHESQCTALRCRTQHRLVGQLLPEHS